MIVAKTVEGWQHISRQFDRGTGATAEGVQLEFNALVHGQFEQQGQLCASDSSAAGEETVETDAERQQALDCTVLQLSRGTHARNGYLSLLNCQIRLDKRVSQTQVEADVPANRVAPALMRQLAGAGFPVVGAQGGTGGTSSEQSRRELSAGGMQGTGTTTASTVSASGRGGKGKNTLLALIGLKIPKLLDDCAAPGETHICVSHVMPAKFELLIKKEQARWDQRDEKIKILQRALSDSGVCAIEEPDQSDQQLPLPAAYVAGCAVFCDLLFQLGREQVSNCWHTDDPTIDLPLP